MDVFLASLRFATWVLALVVVLVAAHYVIRTTGGRFWVEGSAARSALGIPLFLGLALHQFGFWIWHLAFLHGKPEIMTAIASSGVFILSCYLLILAGMAGILSGFLLQLFGRLWPLAISGVVLGLIAAGSFISASVVPK